MTLIPLLVFAIVEGALRLVSPGYPTRFLIPVQGTDAVTTNPRFGWRFFPRTLSRTPVVTRIPVQKPPNTYRIFVLGGSAALGTPEPAYSFGRILEVMLRDQFPDHRFEVVNAAMTAINSHVIREIARDCARYQPDLFIVYAGNNEVVGPFGPGTVFMGYQAWLPFIHASLWARTTRIGQTLQSAMESRTSAAPHPTDWRGMELFLDKQVSAISPALETVAHHFNHNLNDVCVAAADQGADTLLCTVAVNLDACPPFASLHRPDLSSDDLQTWEQAYQVGMAAEESGRYTQALDAYATSSSIDDTYADIHFRIARCRAALAQPARPAFARARDLDALRFRADSRLNQVIRDVAATGDSTQRGIVDIAARLADAGTPDADLFLDHVHFTFDGNYAIAHILYDQVAARLPELSSPRSSSPPSPEECARRLAFTAPDRLRMAQQLWRTMGRAPFTAQLDHAPRREATFRHLRSLAGFTLPPALGTYRDALDAAPDDLFLRQHFARLLAEQGDPAGAEIHWRVVLDLLPEYTDAQVELGAALLAQNRPADARALFEIALAGAHAPAEYANQIGEIYLAQGNPDAAIAYFRRGIELQPGLAQLHSNLGSAHFQQSNPARARDHFAEAVRLNAQEPTFHNNLGVAEFLNGDLDAATEHLSLAIALDPFSVPTYDRLALVRARKGDVAGAAELLARALELDPTYPGLRERYQEVQQHLQPAPP